MRGIKVVYKRLSTLLRDGRERKGISIEMAAMLIGMANRQYLWRCEAGSSNFPASKLEKALRLYGISTADAVEAITLDFAEAAGAFFKGAK